MKTKRPTEFCPICGQPHDVPETTFENGFGQKKQIECDCGARLEAFVPIFKQSESGYLFRNVALERRGNAQGD